MNRLFLILCLLVTVAACYGQQRQLSHEDKSGPFDVFAGENNEAGLVVICSEDIALTFTSNRDKTVNVFKTEVQGGDKHYHIRFPLGDSYTGRWLTVFAPRYSPLVLDMGLSPKELRTLRLYDPDVILQGCYNQTMKEGLEIFRMAQYPDARVKYRLAAECSDAPATVIDDIRQKIDIIDSIVRRRQIADESFTLGDRYVELRVEESRVKMRTQSAYNAKSQMETEERERRDTKKRERRRQRTFAFSYETNLGLSFGWYRDRKVGLYFAGRYTTDEAVNEYIDDYSLSAGATLRLTRFTREDYRKWPFGAWVSLGVGYAGSEITETYYRSHSDAGYVSAPFPEAGVLVKLGLVVLKYSYQYRIGYPDQYASCHILGAGLCF